jgi:multisubunit Na+/H+ antiporter MnhB subunit
MFESVDPPERGLRMVGSLLAAAAFAALLGLAYAVAQLPGEPSPLAGAVAANLPASGLGNPVNAVLLNFRAYDTLLETGVLVLALVGGWMLATDATWKRAPANFATRHVVEPPLIVLVKVLVPLVALSAVYLLFLGSSEPGGAFQAGTILAAVAILLILARIAPPPDPAQPSVRWAVAAGFLLFALAGFATLALGRGYMDFPPAAAYPLIIALEVGIAVSVAAALMLLAGGLPDEPGRDGGR